MPYNNYETSSAIEVGGYSSVYRGLLKFDLSSIPTNATVTSAKLYLTITSDYATYGRDFCVYRLKQSWSESSVNWSSPWSSGGASGASDVEATDIGCVSLSASESVGTQKEWTLSTSDVQEMVDGTWTNYGFLIRANTENYDRYAFASSSYTTASYRPKLIIEYSVPETTPTPPPSWESAEYVYGNSAHIHAVTSVDRGETTDTYTYDLNGSMTCRYESGSYYKQDFSVENRLSQVTERSNSCTGTVLATWTFTYDGDGTRVKQVYTEGESTLITYYFFGGAYEVRDDGSTQTVLKYYAISGMTVAMYVGENLQYILTDHLGSVIAVTDASGDLLNGQEERYLPFGTPRSDLGAISQTDYGYTFQRDLPGMGLMDYRARFYDPLLGRFIQPDSIVPSVSNPQAFNRYSYVLNQPVNFNDPTGHFPIAYDTPASFSIWLDVNLSSEIKTNQFEAQYDPYNQNLKGHSRLCGYLSAEMIVEAETGEEVDFYVTNEYENGIYHSTSAEFNKGLDTSQLAAIIAKNMPWGSKVEYYASGRFAEGDPIDARSMLIKLLSQGNFIAVESYMDTKTGRLKSGSSAIHWSVVTGVSNENIYINNPFCNRQEAYSWDEFLDSFMYNVVIARPPMNPQRPKPKRVFYQNFPIPD